MDLATLSIRRPIFITCVIILMLAIGLISLRNLGVDLFPDVNFPVVAVETQYRGAGPEEVETLISKPIEEKISTIAGLKRVTSQNREGLSVVIAEFQLEVPVDRAEQQVRDKVNLARPELPNDVEDPVITRFDPADQAILTLALNSKLSEAERFDLADDLIKPLIEQRPGVGRVEIVGGRKREIQVLLDRAKLRDRELSVASVAQALQLAGENIPSGKVTEEKSDTTYRTLGEFESVNQVTETVVRFFGNDRPVLVRDVGTVEDRLEDEVSRAFVNAEPTIFVQVYRQSGSNTIAVVDGVLKQLPKINAAITARVPDASLTVVRDGSAEIRANVLDVTESILIGIVLTIFVVFLFLGSIRSTIITGLALPNSLLGAFILVYAFGFTINVVTLLALSLSVGLLVDDAIVVRENIFKYLERGYSPLRAAILGTQEVRLAVIATTFVILAVFGSVAFLQGFVGQFFKEFGLTICFAMVISLFDALTIAPMLSAYFASADDGHGKGGFLARLISPFDWAMRKFASGYDGILVLSLRNPLKTMGIGCLVFAGGLVAFGYLPKTFIPPSESGEFIVLLDLPPGTNLDGMQETAMKVDRLLAETPEIEVRALSVGELGAPNKANFFVRLIPFSKRSRSTPEIKDAVRAELEKSLAFANPIVADFDPFSGGGAKPFQLNLKGEDQKALEAMGAKIAARLRNDPRLVGVDLNFRPGKPEVQFEVSPDRAARYGLSTRMVGDELRAQVDGIVAAKFRVSGNEYDIRVRIADRERDLKTAYASILIPNLNGRLIPLSLVAGPDKTEGPSTINRQDRTRFVQISADIAQGSGLGDVMAEVTKLLTDGEFKLPPGMSWAYVGDSENFEEFGRAMVVALGLAVLFIFLVLASLYESFVTPMTIMLALPLAVCGAFYMLLGVGQTVDLFSMIGVIMLLGVSSKNSILLVDFANERVRAGVDRTRAMMDAGRERFRPIIMTSMALIAGTIPIAIGLNEASSARTSMGWAILGGLISSTLLTLVVVPCAYLYIDRVREWIERVGPSVDFRELKGADRNGEEIDLHIGPDGVSASTPRAESSEHRVV